MQSSSSIKAVITVLDRLVQDMETLRRGAEAIRQSLPEKYTDQRKLLSAQCAAFERVAISLTMAAELLGRD